MSKPHLSLAALPVLLLAACASTAPRPDVPAALNPPAGQSLALETLAEGVQIYECSQKADGSYEWAFKFPEARLLSRSGHALGKHYAGPTWESADGSTVVGQVVARDPGPDTAAIPWLLLNAKANTGKGAFAEVKSIQRVYTAGGLVANEACTAARLKQVARVPYTATYYYYK
jgi:hypothetical protein